MKKKRKKKQKHVEKKKRKKEKKRREEKKKLSLLPYLLHESFLEKGNYLLEAIDGKKKVENLKIFGEEELLVLKPS
ncbi:hypothetical protein GCM10010392_68770 [Streptomyces clavifer]|nr:hypothetical protein GCM10010392_68770 [Streptomyces clavifer]